MQSRDTFADELAVFLNAEGRFLLEDQVAEPTRGRPGFEPFGQFPQAGVNAPYADQEIMVGELAASPLPNESGVYASLPISEAAASLRQGAIEDLLADELGIDVNALLSEARQRSAGGTYVGQVVADYGTEAFATYLPWHMYACNRQTPWGMYFFLEPIIEWAADMQCRASKYGLSLNDSQALRLAFYVCYRHELFHFHVESFCIRQEILSGKPIYLPYDHKVFQPSANTDDWLEESLAQAVVLESTTVSKKTGMPKREYRAFLEAEFDRFGPGYRNFRCTGVGGPALAHELLAAQIMSASTTPRMRVTKAFTPKREYSLSRKKVPGYVAWNPAYTSRFQLATPKKKNVHAYLRANGFDYLGPGPGDHEKWRLDKQTIQVNFRKNESDLATIKAIAKVLEKSVRVVIDEMEGRRDPLVAS